jgi:hypothetical protein
MKKRQCNRWNGGNRRLRADVPGKTAGSAPKGARCNCVTGADKYAILAVIQVAAIELPPRGL